MNTPTKILIVEDEAMLQKVLKDKLTREGFDIVTANDGVSGLQSAHDDKPDLILLDIVMPVMDGVSMLKKLREDTVTENIPVIIISNLSEVERITEALEAKKGVVEHLIKSHWSMEELVGKIKETLKVYDMLKQ